MANNCSYMMRIVGKTEESVSRFIRVLQYKDYAPGNGLYLARIFSAETTDPIYKDGDLFVGEVVGDCAWGIACCMSGETNSYYADSSHSPMFSVWRGIEDGEIRFANIDTTVPMLCELLDVGVEIWSEEPGMGFQEHWIVSRENGENYDQGIECVNWTEGYDEDENGECERNPNKDEGGFDDYGIYLSPNELHDGR